MTSQRTSPSRPDVLALILARGGSKGVPRKNLVPLLGKPLIAHTLETALACKNITRVVVSTDDEEIAAVSKKCGADVPFIRPAELAQDFSTDLEAFDHALRWLAEKESYRPKLVVHLRATGPARKAELVDKAIALMLAKPEATCLRSVSVPELTPYKMWRIEGEWLKPLMDIPGVPEPHSMPRQKLPPVYWHNPYVDVIRSDVILEKRSMCGDRVIPFVIDDKVVDIDEPEDLPRAEAALKRLRA